MEFLRFGSSIPGSYWGCCAMCIIQYFNVDPDAKASIQIMSGDGGQPIGDNFAGLTYREIFETRLRIGTFNTKDMPSHGFLAILTDWQLASQNGKKWSKLLKDNGFEFIRTVSNSVYTGNTVAREHEVDQSGTSRNHLFGLFRNICSDNTGNPFLPPEEWTELEGGVKQACDYITRKQSEALAKNQFNFHKKAWEKLGPPSFYTEAQVEKAGVTVTYGGQRSLKPQEPKKARLEKAKKEAEETSKSKSAPFLEA